VDGQLVLVEEKGCWVIGRGGRAICLPLYYPRLDRRGDWERRVPVRKWKVKDHELYLSPLSGPLEKRREGVRTVTR